jgi:hypothetical protein
MLIGGSALLAQWVTQGRLHWPDSYMRLTRLAQRPCFFGLGQRPGGSTRPIPILNLIATFLLVVGQA